MQWILMGSKVSDEPPGRYIGEHPPIYRYDVGPDPIREVLQAMTGKEPPSFVRGYDYKGLTDEQVQELQDWCCVNVKPEWLTGIGLMDAAENQVAEAVSNGNIAPVEAPKKQRRKGARA